MCVTSIEGLEPDVDDLRRDAETQMAGCPSTTNQNGTFRRNVEFVEAFWDSYRCRQNVELSTGKRDSTTVKSVVPRDLLGRRRTLWHRARARRIAVWKGDNCSSSVPRKLIDFARQHIAQPPRQMRCGFIHADVPHIAKAASPAGSHKLGGKRSRSQRATRAPRRSVYRHHTGGG